MLRPSHDHPRRMAPNSWRLAAAICFATLLSADHAHGQAPALVEFSVGGKVQQGLKLVEFASETVIIGRDGWLHWLDPHAPSQQIRPVEGRYEPLAGPELRNALRAEFGRDFEVVATQHFLVVQPVGRGNRWPDLFEQSHRAFLSFMQRRGVEVRAGRFPMVAIVFPDERAMYEEFRRLKIDMARVAGIYANSSNRVMTHDGGHLDLIAATVRHEAAHQSAFNSGVHSRLNDTPKWITEGIGQLFEPAEIVARRGAAQAGSGINFDSLQLIQSQFSDQDPAALAGCIDRLVCDDTMFADEKEIKTAYAVSWAMMYFLAHRQSDAFASILNQTSARPPFELYSREQKRQDFQRIVGVDTIEFSKRVHAYLKSLR